MPRLYAILLIIGLVACNEWKAPDFCSSYDCPRFKTVSKLRDDIEIRDYEESKWVSVELTNRGESQKNSFWKLFKYISGENSKNEKMDMTAPVLFKINSQNSFSHDESIGTMSFFMSPKIQDAPTPNDGMLKLQTLAPKKYAVISYRGYSNQEDQEEHLKTLGAYLKSQNINFVRDYYFFAGYDSPFKFWNRHNEIWIELI